MRESVGLHIARRSAQRTHSFGSPLLPTPDSIEGTKTPQKLKSGAVDSKVPSSTMDFVSDRTSAMNLSLSSSVSAKDEADVGVRDMKAQRLSGAEDAHPSPKKATLTLLCVGPETMRGTSSMCDGAPAPPSNDSK